MTENRRIFWNIVSTYGRSLYGLIIGLLCGRWALMALGEVDFGLYGLVGGLIGFISFFNSVLASANARFYAISIGAAKTAVDKCMALEECRRWFNTALSVHLVIPIVLVSIGYPLGDFAIKHWLTIPAERIDACVWVFRFVCLSCFVGMANVPFHAMYGAKQYIAELTIYGFVTATLNVVVLYYMIVNPGDWLAAYAGWICMTTVVPQIIICIRACLIFPECRVVPRYMWNKDHLKRLGVFSGWQFLGMFCGLLRTHGLSIVVNKLFGARMNAAYALGNGVQSRCNSLAGAMQGAFVPVITQAYGAGDLKKMNRFVLRTCKFNVFLSLIFMMPLALEIDEVMVLWLKHPPAFSSGLCLCAMVLHLVSAATVGHMVAVNASGRVAAYYTVLSAVNIFVIPVSVCVMFFCRNVYLMMAIVIFFEMVNSVGRIFFARLHAGVPVSPWLKGVLLPMVVAVSVVGAVGFLPHLAFQQSFLRVVVTTIACEVVFLPMLWFVILDAEERAYVGDRILKKIKWNRK